jgi:hypothetical protein
MVLGNESKHQEGVVVVVGVGVEVVVGGEVVVEVGGEVVVEVEVEVGVEVEVKSRNAQRCASASSTRTDEAMS